MTNKFFNADQSNGTLTLSFYDMIGDMGYGDDGDSATPAMVANALKGDFDNIELHLNSPGGDAFAGVAIYNLLKACSKPVNVIVDGLAASAASIVAMAGDNITMCAGSTLMIHEAMAMAFGNAADMTKMADTLTTVTSGIADIYVARTGLPKKDVLAMQAEETWMSADDAVKKGFATSVNKDQSAVKNCFDLKRFRNAPAALKIEAKVEEPPAPQCTCIMDGSVHCNIHPDGPVVTNIKAATECECECQPCVDGDCTGCTGDPCDCVGCTCSQHTQAAGNSNLTLFRLQLELNRRK